MPNYKANKKPEGYKKDRQRKIENLLSKLPTDEGKAHFKRLDELYSHYNELAFSTHLPSFYAKFRANLKYIQLNSGLNITEFSNLCRISNVFISRQEPAYLRGLPLHTFFKAYSLCLVYLPTLDFCDMFTLDFSTTFPFLAEKREENRQKLGKKPRKKG